MGASSVDASNMDASNMSGRIKASTKRALGL